MWKFKFLKEILFSSEYRQLLPALSPGLRDKRARVILTQINLEFWCFWRYWTFFGVNWQQSRRNGITPTDGVLAQTDISMTLSSGQSPFLFLLKTDKKCPLKVRLITMGWRVRRSSLRLCEAVWWTFEKVWLLQMGQRVWRLPPRFCPLQEIWLLPMGRRLRWPSLWFC